MIAIGDGGVSFLPRTGAPVRAADSIKLRSGRERARSSRIATTLASPTGSPPFDTCRNGTRSKPQSGSFSRSSPSSILPSRGGGCSTSRTRTSSPCTWTVWRRLGFPSKVDRVRVFQLGSESDAARLVIVNLVVDLGDRESMDSKLQRFARAARRWRTCARYSASVIVSAASRSISEPRRSISTSHDCAAPASGSSSRLRIGSRARRARSSTGREECRPHPCEAFHPVRPRLRNN
jgi:hypothetical protein